MLTSIEIAQLLMAQKKKKQHSKKFNFDGAIINLGVVKKGLKKTS